MPTPDMSCARRLSILSTLSGWLTEAVKPEGIFRTAIEIVAFVMESEVVLIYLLDADENELSLSEFKGLPAEFARGVDKIKLGEGFNGRVAESGQPMMVSNAAKDPRLSRDAVRRQDLRALLREGLVALLIVPMKSRGHVVGTICAATCNKREFKKEEAELLAAIGNQIGIAIDKARLYEEQLAMMELLRLSEAKYRALFQESSDAIIVHDMDGNINGANKACEKLLGYTVVELAGKKISDFLSGDGLELAWRIQNRLLNGEKVEQRYEQHIFRRDGTEAIVEMSTRIITMSGKPVGFENIGRDVTEQRKMQDNLRFYLEQVLRAQEEERKRLSRELHDDTSQSLLLLIRRLDALASDPKNKLDKPVKDEIARLHNLTVEILDGLRRYAQELRPAVLDQVGLVAALRWIAENIIREQGIEVNVEVVGEEREITPETKLVVFRIAQEALTNVKKHAEATEASVKMQCSTDKIVVTIVDNGKGFKLPKRLGDLASAGMLGLAGMEERARLLGGTLQVQSKPGEGTAVTAELPLNST